MAAAAHEPAVLYGLLWIWIADPTSAGLLAQVTSAFGLPVVNLRNDFPLFLIILANGIVGASFAMVILTSAVRSIPAHLSHAARVDGASEWGVLRHVVAPALSQPIRFITIYQALSLMTTYEYILLITGGGPVYDSTPYALYIYRRAFENGAYAYGAALALGLMVIGVVVTLLQWRLTDMRSTFAAQRSRCCDGSCTNSSICRQHRLGAPGAARPGQSRRLCCLHRRLPDARLHSGSSAYLWLLVKSLTLSDDRISHMVLWRTAAIAGLAYLGALALSLAAARMRSVWLGWAVLGLAVAILAAIFVVPYLTVINYRFLWTSDINGTGTTGRI